MSTAETAAVAECCGVGKRYSGGGGTRALVDVSIAFHAGEMVAITGPSGAGKSTLLHLLGVLTRPSDGDVLIAGQPTANLDEADLTRLRRRHLGFVFQFFNLLAHLNARDNVIVPAILDGQRLRPARARATELLERVGLGERIEHRPEQLSGGEMQRVAIARALMNDPALVLADEPTGNLDSKTAVDVLALLRACTVEQGKTLILVTHDPDIARAADREVVLRDGRIVADDRTGG